MIPKEENCKSKTITKRYAMTEIRKLHLYLNIPPKLSTVISRDIDLVSVAKVSRFEGT